MEFGVAGKASLWEESKDHIFILLCKLRVVVIQGLVVNTFWSKYSIN